MKSSSCKQRTLYKCEHCGYETNRKYNLQLHLNKKTSCKTVKDDTILLPGEQNVVSSVNSVIPNVNIPRYRCETCFRTFTTRQSKHRHVKRANCSAPDASVEDQSVIGHLHDTIQKLQNKVTELNENNSNVTNINTVYNTNNVTINQYFSYDRPYIGHVNAEVVKQLYLDNERNMKRMINEATRTIYKQIPKNNSFNFPLGVKSNFVEVFYNNEKRILPLQDVIDVVLQQTSAACERHLRAHYYDGSIKGTACLNHADVLEDLAVQSIDTDKEYRLTFFPSVKTAIMECLNAEEKEDE